MSAVPGIHSNMGPSRPGAGAAGGSAPADSGKSAKSTSAGAASGAVVGSHGALRVGLGDAAVHGADTHPVYARLKRVILLGGAVRPTALSEGIDRSLLD